MDKIVLEATKRNKIGKQVRALRRQGKLPAVIYGKDVESLPISLDFLEASKILQSVSGTTLVTIDVEGEEYAALVRERQRDVLLRDLLHVDFLAVSLTETVRAQSRISIVGVAPAIKAQNAVITQVMESLEIEALPTDLMELVEVDVSGLESIGDTVLVKDIPLPTGVNVIDDPDSTVAVASAPEILEVEEEEEEEEELELVEGEPEVIEKGKAEEEEEEDEYE